jgi:uncharacterized surface protein with fasciclin (FAS1) repeats
LINSQNVVTVFVPTNQALSLIPNWDQIAADDAAMNSFVRSHIVTGGLTAEDIFAESQLTTINDERLVIDPAAETINDAHIVTANQQATNGYFHTIDRALVVP